MVPDDNIESTISIKNVSKIFGENIERSQELLADGKGKDEIQDITGDTVGVNNVSLEVKPQETFIVMGLSGSGKSTLVRCVIRLIEPTSGSISINGNEVMDMDENELRHLRRKELGMVFQQFALFPHRKVIDNVAYGLEVQGISKEERYEVAKETLEMVGLEGWEDYYPRNLSGGMQQRVGLARALAHDPNILLMDEPFSALDPLIRRDMQEELVELQKEMNKTILFITHDLDEALMLGDRIAIMNEGEVVQIGTAKEIVTEPADDYVAEFVGDVDRFQILTARDVTFSDIPVLKTDDNVSKAWEYMSESGSFYVVLADEDDKLVGMVYLHDIRGKMENGEKATLDEMPVHQPETSAPDVKAEELLPKMTADSHPVVLIDEEKRIEGVVDASSLVSALIDK